MYIAELPCTVSDRNVKMICDLCGKAGSRTRRVARSYGRGARLLVIEDVPVVTCPHCGGNYLTAKTLHEIERIKLERGSFAKPRRVPVVTFGL